MTIDFSEVWNRFSFFKEQIALLAIFYSVSLLLFRRREGICSGVVKKNRNYFGDIICRINNCITFAPALRG